MSKSQTPQQPEEITGNNNKNSAPLGGQDDECLLAELAKINITQQDISTQTECLLGVEILVVEDSSPMRRILCQILSHAGAVVEEAANGIQAIGLLQQAVVQKKSFHLVLLDLMMPLLTGFETLKTIRKNKSLCHIPVIIVSAKTRREDIALCARLGISGYIIKPFDSKKMLAVIIKAISE